MPPPAEAGLSRKIEKGADLVVQLHYHPSGKVERDQSTMGIHLAPAPTKGVATVLMLNTNLYIPAGASEHRVKASMTIPATPNCSPSRRTRTIWAKR